MTKEATSVSPWQCAGPFDNGHLRFYVQRQDLSALHWDSNGRIVRYTQAGAAKKAQQLNKVEGIASDG